MTDAEPPTSSEKPNFWVTLPGILTGVASVIGAVTALIIGLKEANIIGQPSTTPPSAVATAPVPTEDAAAEPKPTTPASVAAQPTHASTEPFQLDAEFKEDFARYLDAPDHKAFFVAVDDKGDWEYDWSDDSANQAEADADAAAGCQADVQESQIQATCKAYARGNSIIW